MKRRKVGLALGGGAARGLAHIGVPKVLETEGIPIDMIAGTSAGAAIGALYAQGKDANLIENQFLNLSWKRLAYMVDLALPKSGFIGGKKIKDELKLIIGGELKFNDLKISLACVATDIMTGEEVVIDQGSVLEGVRASISIPGILTVMKWRSRYLVDGGLVNPVPVSVLKKMGADFTIAVDVTPDIRDRVRTADADNDRAEKIKEPNIISVILQSIYIATHSLSKASLEGADVAIQPQVAHIGPTNFRQAQECIQQGEVAAEASIL
jgi:NTE family protein